MQGDSAPAGQKLAGPVQKAAGGGGATPANTAPGFALLPAAAWGRAGLLSAYRSRVSKIQRPGPALGSPLPPRMLRPETSTRAVDGAGRSASNTSA